MSSIPVIEVTNLKYDIKMFTVKVQEDERNAS